MRSYILAVLNGRKRGFFPLILKGILCFASLVYGMLHASRKALYRIGILRSIRLPIPVISVGNLTMGGTGKTFSLHFLSKISKFLHSYFFLPCETIYKL